MAGGPMTADSSDQPSREQQIRRVNNEMRKVLVSTRLRKRREHTLGDRPRR